MPFIDRKSHQLFIETRGEGTPDFICLHGLVDSVSIWKRLAPALAERGRVILVDQRGHGRSGAPAGHTERQDLARDITAVLDSLEIERAILVGHSMGGIMAMATALMAPERVAGLVLIGTASQCTEKVANWYERIATAGEREGLEGIARMIYGKDSEKSIVGDAAGMAAVTRTLGSLYTDPLTPRLSEIRCPALVIVGERDPMGPKASSIIADKLPKSTLEVVADCGHWVHVEQPDAVTAAIDRWQASRHVT